MPALGRDDPTTAAALQNLACPYRDQDRYEQPRALFEEVVAIHEAAYGPDHSFGVDNLKDDAELVRAMGDDVDAAALEARIGRSRG